MAASFSLRKWRRRGAGVAQCSKCAQARRHERRRGPWPTRRPERKTSTPSAKSRRNFTCPKRCGRGRSARSGTAGRCQAMQLEQVPTPQVGEDEALVLVMAAGVNYNGVWAALGEPISRARRAQAALSRRRLRRVRHRLGRRLQGEALEAGRRSRHPLQSGRRRRRRVQWRRSDVLAVAEDLGLRNHRRLVRAILQSAGAPDDAAAEAPHLGRERPATR